MAELGKTSIHPPIFLGYCLLASSSGCFLTINGKEAIRGGKGRMTAHRQRAPSMRRNALEIVCTCGRQARTLRPTPPKKTVSDPKAVISHGR